jgi:hypothetical protein
MDHYRRLNLRDKLALHRGDLSLDALANLRGVIREERLLTILGGRRVTPL